MTDKCSLTSVRVLIAILMLWCMACVLASASGNEDKPDATRDGLTSVIPSESGTVTASLTRTSLPNPGSKDAVISTPTITCTPASMLTATSKKTSEPGPLVTDQPTVTSDLPTATATYWVSPPSNKTPTPSSDPSTSVPLTKTPVPSASVPATHTPIILPTEMPTSAPTDAPLPLPIEVPDKPSTDPDPTDPPSADPDPTDPPSADPDPTDPPSADPDPTDPPSADPDPTDPPLPDPW